MLSAATLDARNGDPRLGQLHNSLHNASAQIADIQQASYMAPAATTYIAPIAPNNPANLGNNAHLSPQSDRWLDGGAIQGTETIEKSGTIYFDAAPLNPQPIFR